MTYAGLVLELNVPELLTELSVLGHGEELGNLLEVNQPVLGAEGVGDELGKAGVALKEPTTSSIMMITNGTHRRGVIPFVT